MKLTFIFLTILVYSFPIVIKAQDDSLLTKWAELSEDDASFSERLQQLTEHPIHINQASKTELAELPFLTSALIDSILAYRKSNGKFTTKYQLSPILGKGMYNILKPFFTVKNRRLKRGYLKHKNYYPINPAKTTQNYNGGLWYNKTKTFYSINPSSNIGIITQKDIGEQSVFDYLSAYISYNSEHCKLILGQYNFQFAHGLAFANPFSTQKSAMVLNPLRGLHNYANPSLSSAENSGLFGLYFSTQKWFGTDFHFFISRHNLDANFDESKEYITDIDYDGYHRTVNEIRSKNKIFEQITGFAISRPIGPFLTTSLLFADYKYTPGIQFKTPVVSDAQIRRQYYHFSGNDLKQFSFSYTVDYKMLSASGELVTANKGLPAYSQKLFIKKEQVQFGVAYWYAAKNFQSPHGSFFAESSAFPQAEQGFYLAAKMRLNKSFSIKAYKFFKEDLWRSYFNSLPQSKDEWLAEAIFIKPRKKIILRIRQKSSTVSSANLQGTSQEDLQTIYRLHYSWNPDKNVRLQTRIAHTQLNKKEERGTYVFQGFRYKFNRWCTFYTRVAFFHTRSFSSALYEYESDLPGSFANYALYGQGHKWYVMLRSELGAHFRFWLKLRYLKRYDSAVYEQSINRELRYQLDYYF